MPTPLETRFLAAVDAHRRGKPTEATHALESILGQWPQTHEAHYLLGMIHAEGADLSRAIACLGRAAELDPNNPEYLYRLGAALRAAGKWEESADRLERAAELNDEFPPLLVELGLASLACRRHDRAETSFRRVAELEPANAQAHVLIARALQALERPEEALAACARAIEIDPGSTEAHATSAAILERSNRPAEAMEAAQRALALSPDHAHAHLTMGKLLHRSKDYPPARAHLERAVRGNVSPEQNRQAHRMLGLVLDQAAEYDEAYRHFLASKAPSEDHLARSHRGTGARSIAFIRSCRQHVNARDIASWEAPPEQRRSPVFFVGFPRSGTTLLEQMLGAHPEVVTTDELPTMPMIRDRLSAACGGAPNVPAGLNELQERHISRLRGLYWGETSRSLPQGALRGKLLIDKHPLNTASLVIARRLFPGSKVIMALRDPRDVVLSCFTMLNKTPIAVALFNSLESTAQFYAQVMDLWLHYRHTLGLPWIEQRYEDLVEDPQGQMRRVLEFLELPWDDSVMRFTEKTGGKRLRSASYQQVTQGIHKRAKGRWQNYEKHYGPALEILRPYLKALGYED